ncbi:MAG: adenylyl-sulfate kinase [Ruminococcus sp.]|nr:adenylyl-sulfate kinase [Ruminococcus sp.]
MNIETTRINDAIAADPSAFIAAANEDYIYRIKRIAENIAETRDTRPVILLSGPSGSGKTTTALILEKFLDEMGHETHTLSMDNYFCPLTEEEKALSVLGMIDLESPKRIDADLLNQHILAIDLCEEFEIPQYDFGTSTRKYTGKKFRRRPGELVIFEGIHALNPDVIFVPDNRLSKIYVSVRTRVTCGDIVLHPSRIRLMRRMIRDKNFRQRSFRETMNMFQSVEAGENKYIMPYKHRSDYDVDTFIAYELSAYRDHLLDQLREMTDVPELAETVKVLEALSPLDNSLVPPESLICEFIGNGQFKY